MSFDFDQDVGGQPPPPIPRGGMGSSGLIRRQPRSGGGSGAGRYTPLGSGRAGRGATMFEIDDGGDDLDEDGDDGRPRRRVQPRRAAAAPAPSEDLAGLFAGAAPPSPIPPPLDDDGGGDDVPSNTSADGGGGGIATRTVIRPVSSTGHGQTGAFRSLAHLTERNSARVLEEARVRLAEENRDQHEAGTRPVCYLCRYGHRAVDAASGPGMQLHGALQKLISTNLVTSGPEETTRMVHRYFDRFIRPAFERAGIAVPTFIAEEVYVHLSTIRHTMNNRIFLVWATTRMRDAVEALYAEASEDGVGCNVAKMREARMTIQAMHGMFRTDVRQLAFGEPTAADMLPDLSAHLSRASVVAGEDANQVPSFLFDEDDEEET